MTFQINDYQAEARLARVRLQPSQVSSDLFEELEVLDEHTLRFSTIDQTYNIGCPTPNLRTELHDNDVVAVYSDGFVSRLFDSCDGEATVFITGHCNSNCIMCPCSDHDRQCEDGMNDAWLQEYISMLPAELRYFVITGGEPTLKTEQFFRALAQLAVERPQAEVLLLSNGRSFAAKKMVAHMLSACPRYLSVGIPLHGHNSELHDYITRAEGSFRQTCMGIRNLLAAHIAVELRIVVSKPNYLYLVDIARLIAIEFPQVMTVNFVGLETLGNCAKNFHAVYIDYRESFAKIRPAAQLLIDAGINVSLYNYPLCTVERAYWPLCRRSITPYKIRYAPACSNCEAHAFCGGYFASTLAIARPNVIPIHF